MLEPSDIPTAIEKMQIYFFYAVGSFSLVINSATLVIIIRKNSLLTSEFKLMLFFQQV